MMRILARLAVLTAMIAAVGCGAGITTDYFAKIRSLCNYEDDGIGRWKWVVAVFAEEHHERLPTPAERAKLASPWGGAGAFQCDTRGGYTWDDTQHSAEVKPPVPLAWCSRPHGSWHPWRNVLFTDLTLRHVPVEEFDRLMDRSDRWGRTAGATSKGRLPSAATAAVRG